jgi:hypothetical protein
MAAAASGSVVEREASGDTVDRKLEHENGETPQEGTEKHMEVVEVEDGCSKACEGRWHGLVRVPCVSLLSSVIWMSCRFVALLSMIWSYS